jgi:hypothetical protein
MSLLPLLLAACGYKAPENDQDRDGYLAGEGDCDDNDASIGADAADSYADNDGDGFGTGEAVNVCINQSGYARFAGDCDDEDANIHPEQDEICDGFDNNCDETVDDDAIDAPIWAIDADGDGFGSENTETFLTACTQPAGYVADTTDCDDGEASVNPNEIEVCDGLDNDCNETIDDDATDALQWWLDDDRDGFGTSLDTVFACEQPVSYVDNADDCDDNEETINPDGTETCDVLDADEDCNGMADDGDTSATGKTNYYADGDSDTYGTGTATPYCDAPAGLATNNTDCDDTVASVNPGETEICDASDTDEDCDSLADDADGSVAAAGKSTFYFDNDADTYGDATTTTSACDQPVSYVSNDTDCDDLNAAINPDATEACDAADADEDCNGLADDDDSTATGKANYYADTDGDTYGAGSATPYCDPIAGYVSTNTDCDDTSSAINPGATEICDAANIDEDCDSLADDLDSSVSAASQTTYYRDSDSDTYGNLSSTSSKCDLPSGYVTNSTDCDDTSSSINPGATEICDVSNTDEDCDSLADDSDASTSAASKMAYYADVDSDGYGDATTASTLFCDDTSTLSTDNTDCDDSEATTYPGAAEVTVFDGIVNDCDAINEGPYDAGVSGLALLGVEESQALADYSQNLVNGGDIDGDGRPDLIVGASHTGDLQGEAYLLSGTLSGIPEIDTVADQIWQGSGNSDQFGYIVNAGFDLDSDGFSDYILSAAGASSVGRGCLVYGGTLVDGTYDSAADCSATFDGSIAGSLFGIDASGGDFDGDGLDDLAISTTTSGVYVFAGRASRFSASLSPSNADWSVTSNDTNDLTGYNIDLHGDFNSDGLKDLVVTAPYNGAYHIGHVAIILGTYAPISGTLDSQAWTVIDGTETYQSLSTHLTSLPDIDGDGGDEILIGAPYTNGSSTEEGAAYLFLSATLAAAPITTVASADYTFTGHASSYDYFGYAVASGDTNSDGMGDLLICSQFDDTSGTDAGAAYFYDGAELLTLPPGTVDMTVPAYGLAIFTGTNPGDNFCASAAFYDYDGDGDDDLAIGAPYDSTSYTDAGAVNIITSQY